MTKQTVLDFLTRHSPLCGTILLLVNMVNAYRDRDTGVGVADTQILAQISFVGFTRGLKLAEQAAALVAHSGAGC